MPPGDWYDFWTDRRYAGPTRTVVDALLDRIPIFVRGGAIVPTQQVVEYTDQAPINPMTFEIYPDRSSSRDYYEDDGLSFDYQRGVSLDQRLSVSQNEHGVSISISSREGSDHPPAWSLVLKVHSQREKPQRVAIEVKNLPELQSSAGLDGATEGWAYDDLSNTVWIKAPDQGTALAARIAK